LRDRDRLDPREAVCSRELPEPCWKHVVRHKADADCGESGGQTGAREARKEEDVPAKRTQEKRNGCNDYHRRQEPDVSVPNLGQDG
jgi:hypothetical protein